MPLKDNKSGFSTITEEELSLSSIALLKLIQSTLAKEASFRFRAKGFSMSPFIKDNDIVTISALSGAAIDFGEPIIFIHPQTGKLIIHRVVGRDGDAYLIKGDSVPDADGSIPKENILGCVAKVERKGKIISFGLGPERFIIGFLSRTKLLSLIFWFRKTTPSFIRRFLRWMNTT